MCVLRLSPNCVNAPRRSPRSGNVVPTKSGKRQDEPDSFQHLSSYLELFAIACTSGGKIDKKKSFENSKIAISAKTAGDTAKNIRTNCERYRRRSSSEYVAKHKHATASISNNNTTTKTTNEDFQTCQRNPPSLSEKSEDTH